MANYNNGNYIEDAIVSVLSQTYKNFELVIVDDASTDNSLAIISGFLNDPRIKVYSNPTNRGCGFTKREAVAFATGEVAGFLDPDDVLLPKALEIMMNTFIKNPLLGFLYSKHFVCDENLVIKRGPYGVSSIPAGESYLSFGKGISQFSCFKLSIYKETAGINPDFPRAVDQDLYFKLEEITTPHFIDAYLYKYRVTDQGISTGKNISKARYWFARAKEDAFTRRTLNPSVKNISSKDLRAWWSVVYISKAADNFKKWRFCTALYWSGKSISTSIWDQYFLLKMKTLFLNTVFHRGYQRLFNS